MRDNAKAKRWLFCVANELFAGTRALKRADDSGGSSCSCTPADLIGASFPATWGRLKPPPGVRREDAGRAYWDVDGHNVSQPVELRKSPPHPRRHPPPSPSKRQRGRGARAKAWGSSSKEHEENEKQFAVRKE